MNQSHKILFLSSSFYPYRVPVFDTLFEQLGDRFLVVSIDKQRKANSQVALSMGHFPRRILRGFYVFLSTNSDSGKGSPMGLLLTPSLPLALWSMRPAIVISVNFNLWTLTSLLMGYKTIVFWEGTPHTERTVKPWREWIRRWMVRKTKAFVVSGKLARQYLEYLGAPAQRIIEGGLCAELPPQGLATPSRPLDHCMRFLFVGQLIDRKGVGYLLEAIHILHTRYAQRFEVVIVGDGPERSRYEQKCRDAGLKAIVQFVGNKPPQEVWNFYANADVFVLPTLQDHWALVVPEAMSMGLPVLLSDKTGCVPDLLEEGGNGYSFNPQNPQELAERMAIYLDNPALAEQHGRRSRELVRSYTPHQVSQKFLQALQVVQT